MLKFIERLKRYWLFDDDFYYQNKVKRDILGIERRQIIALHQNIISQINPVLLNNSDIFLVSVTNNSEELYEMINEQKFDFNKLKWLPQKETIYIYCIRKEIDTLVVYHNERQIEYYELSDNINLTNDSMRLIYNNGVILNILGISASGSW